MLLHAKSRSYTPFGTTVWDLRTNTIRLGDIYDILLTNSSPDTKENFSFICALIYIYMLRLDV